ncbi:hypothetical protein KIN20_006291 [Parelaphostrongylus tenuis]|uniref:Uncharacterized protein n=1 Tax=Parelaphostrongylus tenuis TaxID=148309 RepID=A0AAD5M5U6_PARTN|nr:hypothetical protein KIN20_006291 [Parelaphostrongylus tenuis]
MELPKEKIRILLTPTTNWMSTLLRLFDESARRTVTKFAMFVQLSVGSKQSAKEETG